MIFKIAGNEKEGLMLLIDKPADCSSAWVVNIIKKKLKVKKAGHSGTLDPKATGLMIVCTQKMTKKLNDLIISDKEYEGIMRIGASTSSFDSETEVKNERDIRHITNDIIHESAKRFIGEI
jgi:tRNA pseudouridine55 synthase